ncbi:MAG: alpha amylase C-terminal domain-containing protein [Eggerthellaceae bacterium]|nr:alpha amylase C-terminal domain-containing protein [Eggerthellaceae bacterium]
MHGDYLQHFATLRALMGWQFARPGKKLTFMGSEFAQVIEWNFKRELDWFLLKYPIHNGMERFSAALGKLYLSQPALWRDDDSWQGFMWANVDDRDESAIACLRHAPDIPDAPDILCCCNFTPNAVEGFTVGLPAKGRLHLLLDSDQLRFGGTDTGARVLARVAHRPFEGQPYSAKLLLPPLSAVFFEFTRT